MEKLNICFITHPGAHDNIMEQGNKIIQQVFSNDHYKTVTSDPDVIFVLTGGSEKQATQIINDQRFLLIIANEANNSYAAASEIKSFANTKNINSILVNIDHDDLKIHLEVFHKVKNALRKFKNYNLGLIGNVSEWLINSSIEASVIKEKLGIKLKKIDWPDRNKITSYPVSESFVNYFSETKNFDLSDSSKVYTLLTEVIEKHEFDAITVECFPLVKEQKVTACLSLSKLMDEGIPAGCEGDLTSIIGMILSKEMFGIIPWMANLISVNEKEVLFAHCTIGTNLLESYTINTHFESNIGTAVQGKVKANEATIFRLDAQLEKAFITQGKVTEIPFRKDACRTQVKMIIPEKDATILKDKPLGNHHIIIPGDVKKELKILCKVLNISFI